MKECHSEFVDNNGDLVNKRHGLVNLTFWLPSRDKVKEMTDLVNKRHGLVHFTAIDSYEGGKNFINSVSFEWISE